jgi:hypothetical protein
MQAMNMSERESLLFLTATSRAKADLALEQDHSPKNHNFQLS